jgi:phosphate-selective porin OprO and OprP
LSRLELDDGVPQFARLMDRARSAPRATEFTLGFNWFLNRFVRLQFNWEYARFANPVRLGPEPGGSIDHQNSFLTRVQIVF